MRAGLVFFALLPLYSCFKSDIQTGDTRELQSAPTGSSSSAAPTSSSSVSSSSASNSSVSSSSNTSALQSAALVWNSQALPSHAKNFNLSFKITAGANLIDAVTGLSSSAATGYDSLSPLFRFFTNGKIEAYNSGYVSSSLNYQSGTFYSVEMSINTDLQSYSVKVTPTGGSAVLIANRFAFRAAAQNLSFINVTSQNGSHSISNVVASAFIDLGNASSSSSSTSSTSSVASSSSSYSSVAPPVVPALVGCVNGRTTSLTYYGITWSFDTKNNTVTYPCGQFANGEPYVVGAVAISNITPNTSQTTYGAAQHGSMKNPIPNKDHGFDSNADVRPQVYDASKNVARSFPFTLNPGDVLVSAKSQAYYPTWIHTYAALTVLNTSPPAGSFRPSLYGTDRTVRYNISQINWSVLKNFTAPAATPSKASIEAELPALPWFEWSSAWNGNSLQGDLNTTDGPMVDGTHYRVYGRDTAKKFARIGLWLNTNQPFADKQAIAIQLIQNGIDIHDYVLNGGGYYHDGGHKCGRKLPLVVAAAMLNDSRLKTMSANPDVFQEDQQIWKVTEADVGRAVDTLCPGSWCGREVLQYTKDDVGKAEWGIRHRFEPFSDNAAWSATYRSTVYDGMIGNWLAASLMGTEAIWNHPPAFRYAKERVGFQGFGPFISEMSKFMQ